MRRYAFNVIRSFSANLILLYNRSQNPRKIISRRFITHRIFGDNETKGRIERDLKSISMSDSLGRIDFSISSLPHSTSLPSFLPSLPLSFSVYLSIFPENQASCIREIHSRLRNQPLLSSHHLSHSAPYCVYVLTEDLIKI